MVTETPRRLSALLLLERNALDSLERRFDESDSPGGPPAAPRGRSDVDAGPKAAPERSCDFDIRIVRGRAPDEAIDSAAREPWCADYLKGAIAAHAEHIAIEATVAGGTDPVAVATWLSVRVHAVLRTYQAAVVVWGGVHAIPAGLFAERCGAYQAAPPAERELPVELWIHAGLSRRDAKVSARTRGLSLLGRPEIELAPVAAELEDAREFLLELAELLVSRPPADSALGDGAIAGELGGAKLVVRRADDRLCLAPGASTVPRTRGTGPAGP